MTLDNYPGSKTNSGIKQFIINEIPAHHTYYELFLGSGAIFESKKRAKINILNDIDRRVYEANAHRRSNDGNIVILSCMSALKVLNQIQNDPNIFIYLDPPYPESARRNGAKYYEYEMLSDAEHVKLLNIIKRKAIPTMISTRQNDLYDKYLKDWRKKTFNTVDRAGAVEEIIYMNYQEPEYLHQYDYVGSDYTERQRIRRKVARFRNKINELPLREKQLFINEIVKAEPAAVDAFLTMYPGKNRLWPT